MIETRVVWQNSKIRLYHGTDDNALNNIREIGVRLNATRVNSDFGRGFYLTTNLEQAKDWADYRVRTGNRGRDGQPMVAPVVLQYYVDRDFLADLAVSIFTLPDANSDYWDFVRHCRVSRALDHFRSGVKNKRNFDVVVGPVSKNRRQRSIYQGYDQWSLHTVRALRALKNDDESVERRSRFGDNPTEIHPPGGQFMFARRQ